MQACSHERRPYLPVEEQAPGLAAEGVADGDLDGVEREVGRQAVEPDDAGPAPPDAADRREAGGRVHRHQGGHQLRDGEGADEQRPRPVEEGEAPAAGHEYQGLAGDAHLQVHRRRHLLRVQLQRPHPEVRLQFQRSESIRRLK